MSGSVGLRVVRGPHWQGQCEDGGEGGLGTVISVTSNLSSKRTALVRWDNGKMDSYRAADCWACDLRGFDSAACGISHSSIQCYACNEKPILGIRWKCAFCHDYDLCTVCYMADKHNLKHPFLRITEPSYAAVAMPPRESSPKIYAKGICPGAVVVRGPDWKWKNQDGGLTHTGVVTEVSSWHGRFKRNAVLVFWSATEQYGLYRLGYKGKVDVLAITYNWAGTYYPHHLPNLDCNWKQNKLHGNPQVAYALDAARVRESTLQEQHLTVLVADSSAALRGGIHCVLLNTDVSAANSHTEQWALKNAPPRAAFSTPHNNTQLTEASGHTQSLDTEVDSASTDGSTELERLRQMELQVMCPICNERRRRIAFDCGHTVCNVCSTKLHDCAECRRPIRNRLQLFM